MRENSDSGDRSKEDGEKMSKEGKVSKTLKLLTGCIFERLHFVCSFSMIEFSGPGVDLDAGAVGDKVVCVSLLQDEIEVRLPVDGAI